MHFAQQKKDRVHRFTAPSPITISSTWSANLCCNNCGEKGHSFVDCKKPIMSFGVIAVRLNPTKEESNKIEYLMICRKNTLGFIDFVRGNYKVFQKQYILNMIRQMTVFEKELLQTNTFEQIWCYNWGLVSVDEIASKHKAEFREAKSKFHLLQKGIYSKLSGNFTLASLIQESCGDTTIQWDVPEWGFPKGRRNQQQDVFVETDMDCAVREFCEETGVQESQLSPTMSSLVWFEEVFMGSNYKIYNHRYCVQQILFDQSEQCVMNQPAKDETGPTETSDIRWMSFVDAMNAIRSYNLEKKQMLQQVHETLLSVFNLSS